MMRLLACLTLFVALPSHAADDLAEKLTQRLGQEITVNESPRQVFMEHLLTSVGADHFCIAYKMQDSGAPMTRCYPIAGIVWLAFSTEPGRRFIVSMH
jgi:hypothetical protein